jgi:hypothetical protein
MVLITIIIAALFGTIVVGTDVVAPELSRNQSTEVGSSTVAAQKAAPR